VGAAGTRHSLRPLISWANGFCNNSGALRRGNAELRLKFNVIASEAKQSISPREGRMDCFVAEPVIGRAFARPLGSSQ
jgi:hypothetical protein